MNSIVHGYWVSSKERGLVTVDGDPCPVQSSYNECACTPIIVKINFVKTLSPLKKNCHMVTHIGSIAFLILQPLVCQSCSHQSVTIRLRDDFYAPRRIIWIDSEILLFCNVALSRWNPAFFAALNLVNSVFRCQWPQWSQAVTTGIEQSGIDAESFVGHTDSAAHHWLLLVSVSQRRLV